MLLNTSSYLRRSNLFLVFVITLGCFVTTYFILGFYYTDYQAFTSALFSGKLTPGVPFRSLYFIANYGISYPISYLYQALPGIEWLSWIYCVCSFLSCLTGLYLVTRIIPVQVSVAVKVFLLCFTYYLVFASNHIHFISSHITFMTAGLPLIALICLFKSPAVIRRRWWLFLLLNVFFTIGTLIRVEASVAACALITFFGVFYLQDIKQCFLIFLYPFILVLSLTAYISFDIKHSTEFYKQIEPDIESEYENRDNKVPLSLMKTHRDSVLYNTASDIIWSDPKIISPQYLRSLILPEKPRFTDARQWKRVKENIAQMFTSYWYLVVLVILMGFIIFLQYDFKGSCLRVLYWLAFEASFFVLIMLETYIYKLNERSFTPYISLFIFCHIIILLSNPGVTSVRWRLVVSFPFLLTLFGFHFYHLVLESGILKSDLIGYQTNYERIKKTASGHYLVLNSSSCDYVSLSAVPFKPFDFSSFKRIYITEGSVIPFIPYYRRYLNKECNCDVYDYPAFYNYLQTISNDVVFISTASRMNVIKTYLKEIHNYNLPLILDSAALVKVEKNDLRDNFDDLKVYRLGK